MTSSIPWDDLMGAADESSVAPIPTGDYNLKIVSCEATTSSTKKPMWKIVAEVEDGPYAGRKIWTQQVLTMDNPNAVAMFFKIMNTIGLNKAYFQTRPSNTEIASAMVGRRFKGKVGIESWDGEDRNRITKWMPLTAGGLTPPPVGGPAGSPPPPPQVGAGAPPPPAAPPAPAAAPAPAAPPAAPPAPPTTAPVAAPDATAQAAAAPVPPPAPASPSEGTTQDPWTGEQVPAPAPAAAAPEVAPQPPTAPPAAPAPGVEASAGAYPTQDPPF